jgi:hypothetical protein
MNNIHPSLQPILDDFAKSFERNDDQIDAMGNAGMYADRIAAQITGTPTQRDLSNLAFLAYMEGWKAGRRV